MWPGSLEADVKMFRPNGGYVEDLPESLRGRRLTFIGDSNDRLTLEYWASQLGKGLRNKIFPALSITTNHTLTRINEYSVEEHDLVVNWVWHGGIMSIPPQPSWHAHSLHYRRDRVPQYENGTAVTSSIDIARVALTDLSHSDSRPIIVVLQSSLRDSKMAQEAVSASLAVQAFEKWDWLKRASSLVMAVGSNSRVEQLLWRTNANCPYLPRQQLSENASESANHWIDLITEKQARLVRNAVRRRVPPWDNIRLVDWRRHYTMQPSATEFITSLMGTTLYSSL